MVQPGDEIPPEAPSASPPPQAHGRTVFSTGAIIGMSVGGAAVIGLAGALFFFIGRAKTLQDFLGRRHVAVQDRASHLYTEQSAGCQGCAPVKVHHVTGYPPAYSSPVMEGRVYAAHGLGAGHDDYRHSVMSPEVETWRVSGYGGQAQELDGQCGAAGRR